jgi:hypothetical protein
VLIAFGKAQARSVPSLERPEWLDGYSQDALIYPLAAFLYSLLQFVGLFPRQASGRPLEDGLAFLLADPFEPLDIVRGQLQLARRQRLTILDNGLQRAHDCQGTSAPPRGQAAFQAAARSRICGRPSWGLVFQCWEPRPARGQPHQGSASFTPQSSGPYE